MFYKKKCKKKQLKRTCLMHKQYYNVQEIPNLEGPSPLRYTRP